MTKQHKAWYSGMASTEDWWAVWLGLTFFILGLLTIFGIDLVGWIAYPKQWILNMPEGAGGKIGTPGKAFYALGGKYSNTAKDFYKALGPIGSILVTYIVFTVVTTIGAYFQKWDVKKFVSGWTIIFFLTYLVWFIGHHAFFAASTVDLKKSGLDMFTLSLGGGASFILALLVGLIIGNFFKPLARFLSTAAKPEWYIKTAIVFLGVKVGYLPIKAVLTGSKVAGGASGEIGQQMAHFTFELFVAGAAATIVAYLIFWPGVYVISRKLFSLPRKTAAVLASAISICGVSAAVATGGAVRARPVVSIMVSALVVVYAVIELVILPGVFTHVWPGTGDPIVAGSAMGMAVKTDGADAAAGELLDEFMRTKVEKESGGKTVWMEGVITTSAVMTKIWIDMFIGLWAFILAMVWVYKIERHEGDRVPFSEVWFRFPKFVLGYFIAWFVYLGIFFGPGNSGASPEGLAVLKSAKAGAVAVEKGMRKLFFMLTFMSLGIITDFKKLAEAQFGKMVWVYFIALTFFIIPVAVIVAFLFHSGMEIPNMAGLSNM
ncbi:MAG: putative sulfate exporter family transporter [Deltaproteobacteria bacterium]|nr:MAG: putative sulfate exporter family transporter [Deltaproteobacteria bacterium]